MAQNLALAPALLLVPHAATTTPPTPANINLFSVPACGAATPVGVGGVTVVDPSASTVGLPNNECVPTPNQKVAGVQYLSFRSYFTTSAPAGITCFTTIFSDNDCKSPVVTVPIGQQNGAVCNQALPPSLNSVEVGIESAKVFCCTA